MRKEITIEIDAPGRDLGKTFFIREMSALRAEKWAIRALQAAVRAGIEIDESVISGGIKSLASLGLGAIATAKFEEIEPLLDELMECVSIIPDPARSEVKRRPIEDDFEEIPTLVRLRMEVLTLHTGFLTDVAQSKPATSSMEPV